MDAIRTEGLTRLFGDITAVQDLTMRVPQGSVFGLLGPNGAGKTTTVRMLTALIAPSEGKAWVDGLRVGKQDKDIRRRVGVLTETPGLYEQLTAARNLEIFARLYEVPDPAGAVEKYLRMLGLWDRRDDLAGTYSKGMRQKLAIARTLMHEPRILFLDEPTAGLDPASARLVRDFIRDLKTQGRTIILCTHNMEEADELCDEIGLFSSRMIAQGTPKELRQRLFGRMVVFHLAQDALAIAPMVENVSGVMEVQAVDNKLVVRVANPEQDNPAIVNALVAVGAGIQFVGEMRHSLEDVYLQLIEEGGHGEN
ncbi:MAG TPA: ABC transporter ATP-binding protein [Chloroflexi bacterium]|nr:ABC transporter ATP-binding protein [Chloroflexota bacterium]